MFEQLYTSSTDVGEKSAVLDALLMRDDVKTLLKLYRTETEPRLKRRMVQALSQMDSPEAQQAVIDILDK
jgi:HEAT repeat protein